jgi:Rhs element Vgr protein
MDEILIPNRSRHDVVTYKILVDEAEVNPAYQLLSLIISREINRIPSAKIVLRDGDASLRTFEISNSNDFVPGRKIQVNIGLDGDNKQAFKGIITRHAVRVKENGNGELHIECRDEAVKMTIGRHSRYYEKMKDNRVFDELIGRYKELKSDPEETKLEHSELVQTHLTDWDFMLIRAEANAMLVSVEDGIIKIFKPDTNPGPVLQLTYGSSVLEFEAEMDARNQWQNVKAFSWDFANQQLFQADISEDRSFAQHGNIQGSQLAGAINLETYEMRHSGHLLEQELQDWVNSIMLRSRMAKIRGRAKFTGFSGIKPGDMVQLEGVGDRFKGKAFVTAVRHEIGDGMWDTHIQFGLDPERFASIRQDMVEMPNSGLAGTIHGLQVGVVVQLQNDPDGQDRIRVKLPLIDNTAEGIWTRVASLDAGSERGAFFRPEIGDEVVVGFINDDPRDAVMIGMLNSSAKPAPITAQDVNHEKGFTTRSKMHLNFNDNTKTITIDTPAGNMITLDESGMKIEIKDQNNNKITMDTSGIKVESPLNIDIKAGAVLTLGAGVSLSISAPSLSVKADANVSIEGATAKLAAQGPNVISGLPVLIN